MRLPILFFCLFCLSSSSAIAEDAAESSKSETQQGAPDYSEFDITPPPVAARFHQCGTVVLNLLVNRGGQVEDIKPAGSSGFEQLDLDAVREAQSVYFPPRGHDGPETVWQQVKFVFPPTSDLPPDKADQWADDVPLVQGAKLPSGYDPPTGQSTRQHFLGGGYPLLARRLNEQGKVIVEYEVGTDGWIHNDRILQSSGWPMLDAEALIDIGFWHFDHPATKNGVPAPIRNQITVTYKLQD